MARAAILVDKPLSKIGLSGRAFVPLLSGFACAIPAMMAVRNIPGHRQRLLCLFIIPLMQCSARLPVYGLLFAMVFPDSPFKSAMGLLVIYIMSVLIASIVAKLAGKYFKLFKSESLFHLELPTWKWPIAKNTIYSVYSQTKSFVVGAGPIIFIISIVLWFLANFPSVDSSFAMMIGQVIEPLFKPMGLDWRVGVAILLSFAAREVFVSVLAVVFAVDSQVSGIVETLSQATFQGSELPIFTTSSIVGLILFFMIALQCGATVAIAKKEMRNWKLPMIQLGVYIALAYVLSVVSVQGLRLMGIE